MPLSSSWPRTLDSQSRNSGSSPDSGTTHAGVAELGRRARLKIWSSKEGVGSSPTFGTLLSLGGMGRRGGLRY